MNPDPKSAVWVQFGTRVPWRLHRDVKLHCVTGNVTIAEFFAHAVSERLRRGGGRPGRRASAPSPSGTKRQAADRHDRVLKASPPASK
jgi:hypothetical protein